MGPWLGGGEAGGVHLHESMIGKDLRKGGFRKSGALLSGVIPCSQFDLLMSCLFWCCVCVSERVRERERDLDIPDQFISRIEVHAKLCFTPGKGGGVCKDNGGRTQTAGRNPKTAGRAATTDRGLAARARADGEREGRVGETEAAGNAGVIRRLSSFMLQFVCLLCIQAHIQHTVIIVQQHQSYICIPHTTLCRGKQVIVQFCIMVLV